MKSFISLILIVFFNLSVFSQDKLIVLHHIVGDTIDKQEQQEFLLFSDILDQSFTFATIHFDDEKYTIHINSSSGLKIVDIKKEDLVENANHVDKLVGYFKFLVDKKDSLNLDFKNTASYPKFQSEFLTLVQKQQIAKEAGIFFSLNQEAEERGLVGVEKENYIKVNSKSWLTEMLFDILK
ncbi:hypothetical protein [Ancylomarina sp. 16SWW S1-10-2]|uniref:hypothetical protein n=1 Tax=Ancylomarina sp. 16SWW S1-10-2 TaxID=2499681 RepID=UPI0012AD6602|nr:hypothetical protein [Ancylomarina sp. 16SWW S1-10-2]MRT91526.1 hypothetical protein [Ancylomarina sp. 16SWW S1-10-2]